MSKKIFSEEEIKILENNKNVKSVSIKGITYKKEFKKIFIEEYLKGKSAIEIFEENGLSIKILGKKRIKSCKDRWVSSYKKKGENGLIDTREFNQGRPKSKELSLEEKYKNLKVELEYLKMENELLKKL